MNESINGSLMEVRDYQGKGYSPLVSYGEWRVAVLRYLDELEPARINTMERHLETDEVFILVHGKAMLILGGNNNHVDQLTSYVLEIGKINNVKKNTWHTISLSPDAHIIIVENDNTEKVNSEYCSLSQNLQHATCRLATDFLAS